MRSTIHIFFGEGVDQDALATRIRDWNEPHLCVYIHKGSTIHIKEGAFYPYSDVAICLVDNFTNQNKANSLPYAICLLTYVSKCKGTIII